MKFRAISTVWKPTLASPIKKIQGSCEVSALGLKSGNGATVISLHDANDSAQIGDSTLRWVLDASVSDADNQNFSIPIIFKKGVFAICEQGADTNPILCLAAINYPAA